MEKVILSDPDIYPSEEIIYSHIGKTSKLWETIFSYIKEDHPDITPEWRYYNDGNSWLMKGTRKTKTIFWLSVIEGAFRMTFYLNSKADELVINSSIPEELKDKFIKESGIKKFRDITILFKNKKDVEYVKELIGIKLKLK